MSKLDDLNAKFDKLIEVMERRQADPAPTKNGGVEIANAEFSEFINKIGEGLMRAGFIPQQNLNQRNVANNNAALTPDELPASISGPVTVLYGLRKLKEKITDANFVIEDLPVFDAVAARPGDQNVPLNAPLDSWSARDVATVRTQYAKLSEVVKELKSLMSPLTLQI